MFLTEESFWSILRNENGLVIFLMTELDKPFSGLDGYFEPYVQKLIPMQDLIP